MGLGTWLERWFGGRRCPSCQGGLVPAPLYLRGSVCQSCRGYYPSPEERAETRAMFRQWRRLLLMVAELHKLGYECTRIVPFVVDTAGGGDWHCIVAPAAMISPAHGAQIDKHIDWWGKPYSPGMDFPYIMGRAYWEPPFEPISAENLIRRYPKLAELCLGRDRDYVEWYQHMLQATAPDGVIYNCAECWGEEELPGNRMRVLTPEGTRDVPVPLPPPGKYQREVGAGAPGGAGADNEGERCSHPPRHDLGGGAINSRGRQRHQTWRVRRAKRRELGAAHNRGSRLARGMPAGHDHVRE